MGGWGRCEGGGEDVRVWGRCEGGGEDVRVVRKM